jgi:hypothetical protein
VAFVLGGNLFGPLQPHMRKWKWLFVKGYHCKGLTQRNFCSVKLGETHECAWTLLENSDSLFHKRDTFYVVVISSLIFVTYGAILNVFVDTGIVGGHVVCPLRLCVLK